VRLASGFALRVDKIDQQQALEIGSRTLHGRYDLSDHYGEFHGLLLICNFVFAACATTPSRPTGGEALRQNCELPELARRLRSDRRPLPHQ